MATYRGKDGDGNVRHPVAPMLRGAFIKALELKGNQEGKTLAEIMLDLIQAEGMLAVMDRIAKFQERTGTLDVNHKGASLAEILTSIGAGHDTSVESEPAPLRH